MPHEPGINSVNRHTGNKTMIIKHIIFVPGKNPKPEAAQHRELLWRTLIEGVRRADAVTAGRYSPTMRSFT